MEEKKSKHIIAGDLGGTNIRLYIIKVNQDKTFEYVFYKHKRTQESRNLIEEFTSFIKDSGVSVDSIEAGVFGIAGPVYEGGYAPFMIDIP